MDDEMIERCIRAHYNEYMKDFGPDAVILEEQSTKAVEKLRQCIIAVIKELSEPTEKMIEAGSKIDTINLEKDTWHAMINSILNEAK